MQSPAHLKIQSSPDKAGIATCTTEAGKTGWKSGDKSAAVRFRGNANNAYCSARNVNSNNSVVNCNANNGGSAQRLKGFVVVARSAEYIRRGSEEETAGKGG